MNVSLLIEVMVDVRDGDVQQRDVVELVQGRIQATLCPGSKAEARRAHKRGWWPRRVRTLAVVREPFSTVVEGSTIHVHRHELEEEPLPAPRRCRATTTIHFPGGHSTTAQCVRTEPHHGHHEAVVGGHLRAFQ